jgi:hypothetical protein
MKQVQPKTLKEEQSEAYLYNFFKREKTWNMRRYNCINQTYSNKNIFFPKLTRNKSRQQERINSFNNMPCFLSATLFCIGVFVNEIWWIVPSKASNS